MAGPSDDRPPGPDGLAPTSAAGPAGHPPASSESDTFPGQAAPAWGEAPDEDARWTSLAGWADVTPTSLRLEDIDPDTTPRGSLRLAPLAPPAAHPPPAPLGPPARPAGTARPAAAAPPAVPAPAPVPPRLPRPAPPAPAPYSRPVASPPPARPAAGPMPANWPGPPPGTGGTAGPGGVPGARGAVAYGAWPGAVDPSAPAAPFWRRRPALTAVSVSLAMLLVAVGLAWVAVAPSCCSGGTGTSAAAATPAAATPQAADGGWTSERRALADRLDPAEMVGCRPNPSPAGVGVTAALFCATPDGRQVAVYAYRDADALRSDVTQRANGVPSEGRCERGENEVFSWDTGPGTPAGGTVVCHHRDGHAFLFWSSDADVVSFLAYDTDPRALVDWWESFEPFPDRAGPTAAPRPA